MWMVVMALGVALAGASDVRTEGAGPIAELPQKLTSYDSRAVALDGSGVLHLIGKRKASLKGGLASFAAASADPASEPADLVYLQQRPDGSWVQEEIPPPSQLTAWGGSRFLDAMIAVDGRGRVFIVASEDFPSPDGKGTDTVLYRSIRDEAGRWTTEQLPTWSGVYDDVQLGVIGDRWIVAAHYVGEGWSGIVRYEEGVPEPVEWHRCGMLVGGLALVQGADEPAVLFRRLGEVSLLEADGTVSSLTGGTSRELSAVQGPEGLVYLAYKAGKDGAFLGTRSGLAQMDEKESGWHNDLALDPEGQPVATWYYRRNAFNKGLAIARPDGAGGWSTSVVVRDEEENRGWNPSLAIGPDGRVALALQNRSRERLEVLRYDSVEALEGAAIPPAGDWTDKRKVISALAYGGAWYQFWEASTGSPDPDESLWTEGVSALEGDLDLEPGVGLEGGVAARYGRFDLALEYLRRSDSEAAGAIQKVQNLAGKLSMDKFPLPGAKAQLHFRAADLQGSFTDDQGRTEALALSDRMLQLRYVAKGNGYFGASHRRFAAPQDVYFVRPGADEEPNLVLSAFQTDASFASTTLIGGWSVMNYLGRYETRHIGPYVDGQVGVGIASGKFAATDGSGLGWSERGLAFSGELNAGLVGYKRFRSLRGAGVFSQVGVRGDLQGISRFATGDENTMVFDRLDRRYGPYANLGLVF